MKDNRGNRHVQHLCYFLHRLSFTQQLQHLPLSFAELLPFIDRCLVLAQQNIDGFSGDRRGEIRPALQNLPDGKYQLRGCASTLDLVQCLHN
jgi:hypothetical protein